MSIYPFPRYVKPCRIPDNHRYQDILEHEFACYWSEHILTRMLRRESLAPVAIKIGLLRCAEYAVLADRQAAESYLHAMACEFTNRQKQISLSKLFGAVYGQKQTRVKLLHYEFDQIIRKIADEGFRLQFGKFPAENHLQMDVSQDEWIFYVQHGPTLKMGKIDFTVIHSASLRQEVKYYLKHRFFGALQVRDRFLTWVAYGVNFLSEHNEQIRFFADMDECDAKALHIEMENRIEKQSGKRMAFSNTMAVFSAMQTVNDYLMSSHRDANLRSPVPRHNPFVAFVFHNSRDYAKRTSIIPEHVMVGMDRHMYELSDEYRLLYQILSQTGMRAKEAVSWKQTVLKKQSMRMFLICDTFPTRCLRPDGGMAERITTER